MPRRIFIVEDHAIVRQMLGEFLARLDIEVCGVAESGEEALERLSGSAAPDVVEADLVLIDVSLPGMTGIDLAGKLQAQRPSLPSLMYSGHREMVYVKRALAAGARGYLVKGNPRELEGAIDQVLDGKTYVSTSAEGG